MTDNRFFTHLFPALSALLLAIAVLVLALEAERLLAPAAEPLPRVSAPNRDDAYIVSESRIVRVRTVVSAAGPEGAASSAQNE